MKLGKPHGFLGRARRSRKTPNVSIYKPGRLRHQRKPDPPVGGGLR